MACFRWCDQVRGMMSGGSKSSIFERKEREFTFESKESDFLNRFIRNEHDLKTWSSQHAPNPSGRHDAPNQPLAAMLAMAKKTFLMAVERPGSGQYFVRFFADSKAGGSACPSCYVAERSGHQFGQLFVRPKPSNFARPRGRCPYLNFPTDGLTGPVDSRITSSGSTIITSRGSTVS